MLKSLPFPIELWGRVLTRGCEIALEPPSSSSPSLLLSLLLSAPASTPRA